MLMKYNKPCRPKGIRRTVVARKAAAVRIARLGRTTDGAQPNIVISENPAVFVFSEYFKLLVRFTLLETVNAPYRTPVHVNLC